MSDDKKDKTLGYEPDLDYDEDYSTDYTHIEDNDEYTGGVQYDDDIMDNIQNNMNNLTILIPGLPLQLQTTVNQVFKPVLLDWRKNFKDKRYPSRIPDSDVPEIIPIEPEPDPDPTPDPIPPSDDPGDGGGDPGDDDDGGGKNPNDDDDGGGGKKPNDDDDDNDGKKPNDDDDDDGKKPDDDDDDKKPDDDKGGNGDPKDPWVPGYHPPGGIDPYDPYDPSFEFIYEPEDDWPGIDETDDEDDIFSPGGTKKFNFVEYDDYEIFELEYVKNVADLYNHYTNELNKILGDYYAAILAMYAQDLQDQENLDFIGNKISKEGAEIVKELRHVMDTALRSEVMSNLKMSFSNSMFSVESTLYHIKNVKTIQALRLRYADQKKIDNKELLDSLSNRMLNGIREMYDAKYDNAYINWYKYLIGSLAVLADIMSTYLSGLKSKEIIIRKGGTKK